MVDVIKFVIRLAVARVADVRNECRPSLHLTRGRQRTEVTAAIEDLEDRGVEAGVATLDFTLLVLYPDEHVLRVEEVLTSLARIGVITEAQRVLTFRVCLAVDRFEDVLGVFLEHLLGLFSELVRIVLKLLVQCLVRCSAVFSQRRCKHGVAISCRVLGLVLRSGSREGVVRETAGFEPDLAGKHVGFRPLESGSRVRPLRIFNELVTLGCHPAVLVVWRKLAQERGHQLHIAISGDKGTKRGFSNVVERTWHITVSLAEHFNSIASLVGKRLNPDAVLLVRTGRPRVLTAKLVRPGDALIAHSERESALTTVTANHVRQSVRLSLENRRVGAVPVTELGIDGDAIQLHVAIVVGSARVTIQAGQVHVAGDQALTNTVSVSQVRSLGDTATSDSVSLNNSVLVNHWSRRIGILIRLRSRRSFLRERNWLCERRNQRKRQRGCGNGSATAAGNVVLLHRKFLPRK